MYKRMMEVSGKAIATTIDKKVAQLNASPLALRTQRQFDQAMSDVTVLQDNPVPCPICGREGCDWEIMGDYVLFHVQASG